ncbi:MAG: hypothetical protein AB8F78_08150 [Saprospiraceae bacterium]
MNIILRHFRFGALLGLLLFLASEARATLAPHTTASRYAHMHEVNARWLHEASPEFLLEEVQYHTEAERIADHLLRVATALESRDPQDLSAQQLQKRTEALSLLRAYAKTGQFPINAHHNERTPYFVDELGTHCAVGYLMRETGAKDIVEAISTETNYGYVLEELGVYPAIETWGIQHGFTTEELAWIQPGYLSLRFGARAFGSNLGVSGGTIYTAESSARGVYLGGSFTEVDGIPVAGLAYLRHEFVEEVVQPYPTIKALLFDTTNLVLYAHGINPTTSEAAVFTVDFASRISVIPLPLSLEDSIHFELTSQGVAIAQQTYGTTPQAYLFHHTLGGGAAQLLADTEWQGTVYDIKASGDTLAVGGNYTTFQNGIRIDSNCSYISLSADTLHRDENRIEYYFPGLIYDTLPGSPIIYNFLNSTNNSWDNYLLSITPSGDTVRAQYTLANGIFSLAYLGPVTEVPVPWQFPTILLDGAIDYPNTLLISGRQSPNQWFRDTVRSSVAWWESASLSFHQFNCNGQIMAMPRLGDSLMVFGNFTELAGQPILNIAFAESVLSDSQEPLKKENYRCFTSNSEVIVSFTSALPSNATLHLYSIDGRHLRENVLPAGQTEFRFPTVDQKLMSYVIQTEDGVAAGILVIR